MAHVNMHQYTSSADVGKMLYDYGKQKRDLNQRERESRRSAGIALQTNQTRLENEREIAKVHETNAIRLARMKAGFDLQTKQMGLDTELLLQKMRNMNNEQIEMLRRQTQMMVETLADEHKQAQILKTYKTQLRLANFNAKVAMLKTFNEVMGDIYKMGDPVNNAVDAAAYGLWVIAFRRVLNMFGINEMLEEITPTDHIDKLDDNKEVVSNSEFNKEKEDEFEKEIRKIMAGKETKPGKITRYPKVGFRTKIKMFENDRAGNKEKR